MLVPARLITGAVALMLAFAPGMLVADDGRLGAGPEVFTIERIRECTFVRQNPQVAQRKQQERRGVLGWLYRYTRNIDLERTASSRLPGFLRSPLLGSLPGRDDDCDPSPLDQVTECVVVTMDPGSDHERRATVPLPQMSVTTPRGLEDRIQEQLGLGEWVSLRTNRGTILRFDRERVRFVEAKPCRSDA